MNERLIYSNTILDSLNEGVYVCDRDRTITYWSKGAERITGWAPQDVVGHRCLDGVLCHVDKDGHALCGEEHCPLHRAMVTGSGSTVPIIVFALGKSGMRIPMQVSVAPIFDESGEVIGGVESFRDMSAALSDLERARRIQALTMEHDLPDDPRIRFWASYTPQDIVGGDYYAIRRLDEDRYGFMLADVMGHGTSAALHTIHLGTLWSRHSDLLVSPSEFARTINNDLGRVVKYESFATATCGVIDAQARTLEMVSAGGAPILLFHANGDVSELNGNNPPFGLREDLDFEEVSAALERDDCLLMLSDGAYEIHDAAGTMLGVSGLVEMLEQRGYPGVDFGDIAQGIEVDLLKYSNDIRLVDDLTFIEVRFCARQP